MATVNLVVTVDSSDVSTVLDALSQSGVSATAQVELAPSAPIPASERRRRSAEPTVDTERPQRAGGKLYRIHRRMTGQRIQAMHLNPQMRSVAAFVLQHGASDKHAIAAGTGIGEKAVESPIYQLRKTNPPILESIDRE